MSWSTIRVLFHWQGYIVANHDVPKCYIVSCKKDVLESIRDFCGIPCVLQDGSKMTVNGQASDVVLSHLCFVGVNCIDFLGVVYDNAPENAPKYEQYLQLLSSSDGRSGGDYKLPKCRVFLSDPDAVVPTKTKASDAGYDLTVIKKAKQLRDNVALYDTGVKLNMDVGYYAEVVPRSSLSKSGYMLANSVGIIDNSYRGNIYVALVKIDPSAPDIEFPFRCCQLIFRKQYHVDMTIEKNDLENTARGEGGFGSTGQ